MLEKSQSDIYWADRTVFGRQFLKPERDQEMHIKIIFQRRVSMLDSLENTVYCCKNRSPGAVRKGQSRGRVFLKM